MYKALKKKHINGNTYYVIRLIDEFADYPFIVENKYDRDVLLRHLNKTTKQKASK